MFTNIKYRNDFKKREKIRPIEKMKKIIKNAKRVLNYF